MIKITKCELCDNAFSVNNKGYVVRRKVAGKLACSKCARAYKKQAAFDAKYTLDVDYKTNCDVCQSHVISMEKDGKFICKHCLSIKKRVKREKMSYEERKKLEQDIRAYKRERTEYLKSIPAEEFIAIVMGEKEDEMPKMQQ